MSKYNVGIGEDFPLEDGPGSSDARTRCETYWQARRERHFRHRHRGLHGPAAAFVVLPAAVASVTVAVLYPLVTLGVIGGAGLVAAAYRRGHWDRRDWEEFRRRHRHEPRNEPPRDEGPQPDAPPKENA